jgi:hypothetical protein
MVLVIDFLPLVGFFFVMIWVCRVFTDCRERLLKVYEDEGKKLPRPAGLAAFNGWAIFSPDVADSPKISEEKTRLRAVYQRRLRYAIPIGILSFFGLSVVSMILHSLLR